MDDARDHDVLGPRANALLSLPCDEVAVLRFLIGVGNGRREFTARIGDLIPQVSCSPERFMALRRRLVKRGLLETRKLNGVGLGTLFRINATLPLTMIANDDALIGIIPKIRRWPAVYAKEAAPVSTIALPLVGHVPRERKPILRFQRLVPCEFVWTVVDDKKVPAKDCSVRASLLLGRSQLGVGGVAVDGFNDLLLQHIGDGQYCRRGITISAPAGTDYTCCVDARRKRGASWQNFGHWEVQSAIDP